MYTPGGGGISSIVSNTAQSGENIDVIMEVGVWGAGGDINGRFTDLNLYYRLVGDSEYRNVPGVFEKRIGGTAYRIGDGEYQHSEPNGGNTDNELYKFIIPAYPHVTDAQIEYYIEYKFDGYEKKSIGIEPIKIIPKS